MRIRKPTILCIDDEVNVLTGREFLLRRHGFNVLITPSGREGPDLLETKAVDAVVVDYRMPEMMGDKVAAQMKRLKREVPLLLPLPLKIAVDSVIGGHPLPQFLNQQSSVRRMP